MTSNHSPEPSPASGWDRWSWRPSTNSTPRLPSARPALPNSPELVRSAQTQLVRLGCLTGKIDGTLNASTKGALGHYMSIVGQPSDNVTVTEDLVSELNKHATRVCPIECKTGETLQGETCIADQKAAAPATASRKNDDEENTPSRRKQREPATASRKNDDEDNAPSRRKQNRQPERERFVPGRRRRRRAPGSRHLPVRASSAVAAAAAPTP